MRKIKLDSDSFNNAIKDYFFLIDRNYPEKGTLKLIGDRYTLSRDERTILYRGISSSEKVFNRKRRIINKIQNKYLIIDGYNVLFTLLNYRLGRFVFISNDGIVRDAGSLHGRFRDNKLFIESTRLLLMYLKVLQPSETTIYIDSPVSHSRIHQELIEQNLKENGLRGQCLLKKSADHHIKKHKGCIISTSDTGIIDNCINPIFDLPKFILDKEFNVGLFQINDILIQ